MDEAQPASPPPIILCAGLPRSGSTWVYNAVLSLCKRVARTAGLYSDTIPDNIHDLIRDADVLVIKSHQPDQKLLDWIRFIRGKVIVTVRDPRDCVASLIEAFDFTKANAMAAVKGSGSFIQAVITQEPHHIVRYEDSLDRSSIVATLATKLGYLADATTARTISDAFEVEKIRRVIAKLEADGTIDSANAAQSWTKETHWHPRHVGDGRVGKYKDFLSPIDAILIARQNPMLMQRFGYVSEEIPALSADTVLDLAEEGSAFAVQGISTPESWGAWTDGPLARFALRFTEAISSVRLSLQFFLGPCLQGENPIAQFVIKINGEDIMDFSCIENSVPEIILIHNCVPNGNGIINIELYFPGIKSPRELDINEDERLLGIGIRRITCHTNK